MLQIECIALARYTFDTALVLLHKAVWYMKQKAKAKYHKNPNQNTTKSEGEPGIFSAISNQSDDYDNLIKAARKAVEHGYRVYLLPNPKGIRSADFIFVRKGVLKLFDLKTITGKFVSGDCPLA